MPELQALIAYLVDKDFLSYDTETDGLTKESRIYGLSVGISVDEAYYVVLREWLSASQESVELETALGITDLLTLISTKNLIMHNGVFDCWMTNNNFKVDLIDALHTDTMALAHLIDENRSVGLKELGVSVYGESAKKEQVEVKENVIKNGGKLTKDCYELYKADAAVLGKYGAKDAVLTLKLFYHLVPELYAQGLEQFFYDDETMPLLRGPTYHLNTTGLRVDPDALQNLKQTLEAECLEAKAFIYHEITPIVAKEYPATSKPKTFNIGASQQLCWLLHFKLGNDFSLLTEGGRELCYALNLKPPYSAKARREFIRAVEDNYEKVYCEAKLDPKTGKLSRPKKVKRPWAYIQCGAKTLPGKLAERYKWVAKYLEYAKNQKILTTYVEGIQRQMTYNVIRPSFNQARVPSGRYSSSDPNFQNLPARDASGQRVKGCIIARPGKVFIGADFSQIEPRVFASLSGDKRLMDCFSSGEDFYSVVGMAVFDKHDCTAIKDDTESFAKKYPKLRALTKEFTLATVYGTTAPQMAASFKGRVGIEKTVDEAQEIIDDYLAKFPQVHEFMLATHEQVKKEGRVVSALGRVRRMPDATQISAIYGKSSHAKLPYEARKPLNLSVNFKCQSYAASIINRSAVRFLDLVKQAEIKDCRLVLNVHDELVVECLEQDKQDVGDLLKYAMENTCVLKGVALEANPIIAYNLRDLK